MTPTNKTCITCNEVKPTTEFYKQRTNKDGLSGYCKSCHLIRTKRNQIKRDYGLSEEAYNNLWLQAASKCAICATTITRGDQFGHAVDHNHRTGEVRGLLCGFCNKGLGMFKDNPTLLKAATAYLEVRGHYGGA